MSDKDFLKKIIQYGIQNSQPCMYEESESLNEFVDICQHNDISGFLLKHLNNNKIKDIPMPLKLINLVNKRDSLSRLSILKKAIAVFEKHSIQYCLIKGFALSNLLYDDIFIRAGSDLDFLVKYEEYETILNILKEAGCLQAYDDFKFLPPHPVLWDTNAHEGHALVFSGFEKEQMEIATSLHCIRGIEKHLEFFSNSVKVNLDGVLVNVFDIQHQFIYLCVNTYYDDENKQEVKARNYMDIGRFIYLYFRAVNWHEIKKKADKLGCVR